MKVLVCYKFVPDEQDIKVAGSNLDMSRAKWKISEYDKNAVEEAAQLGEKQKAEVASLTFGGKKAKDSLKDVLSRGPEKAYWVNDEEAAAKADGFVTANVLAAAIKKIGVPDIVLFGEGSEDVYGQQVGPRVAALLGVPALTFATKLDAKDGEVTVTRNVGSMTEDVTAAYPVVITVLPTINKARIPKLPQILKAKKKPQEELKVADLGLSAESLAPKNNLTSVKAFVMDRKNVVYKGEDADTVAKLAADLAKEGLA